MQLPNERRSLGVSGRFRPVAQWARCQEPEQRVTEDPPPIPFVARWRLRVLGAAPREAGVVIRQADPSTEASSASCAISNAAITCSRLTEGNGPERRRSCRRLPGSRSGYAPARASPRRRVCRQARSDPSEPRHDACADGPLPHYYRSTRQPINGTSSTPRNPCSLTSYCQNSIRLD